MRFAVYKSPRGPGLAIALPAGEFRGIDASDAMFPGRLEELIAEGTQALQAAGERLASGRRIDPQAVEWLPPLSAPGKIICVGLNYVDHSIESGFVPPNYPTLFARFSTSLIGHGAAIRRPEASIQLDYEGEMVAIIGKAGRHIAPGKALSHVAGYSIFNDASIRDFQTKSPQWTVGKNFDGTGSFGPIFVTADELPPGGKGLRIQTRLNGEVVQNASTSDMIFDVASLISIISEAITLEPGDILVTGTPSGVGMAMNPPGFLHAGQTVRIEIDGIGAIENPVTAQFKP